MDYFFPLEKIFFRKFFFWLYIFKFINKFTKYQHKYMVMSAKLIFIFIYLIFRINEKIIYFKSVLFYILIE